MKQYQECSLDQVGALASQLARLLAPMDCVLLTGELGAGKTAFARALIQSISQSPEEVTSPTFTLVQQYDVLLEGSAPALLMHYDLYRLKDASELEHIGISEALASHPCLIEWPQVAEALLPDDRLAIHIDFAATDDTRNLTLTGQGRWKLLLDRLNP